MGFHFLLFGCVFAVPNLSRMIILGNVQICISARKTLCEIIVPFSGTGAKGAIIRR